jgi:hypothetical protein
VVVNSRNGKGIAPGSRVLFKYKDDFDINRPSAKRRKGAMDKFCTTSWDRGPVEIIEDAGPDGGTAVAAATLGKDVGPVAASPVRDQVGEAQTDVAAAPLVADSQKPGVPGGRENTVEVLLKQGALRLGGDAKVEFYVVPGADKPTITAVSMETKGLVRAKAGTVVKTFSKGALDNKGSEGKTFMLELTPATLIYATEAKEVMKFKDFVKKYSCSSVIGYAPFPAGSCPTKLVEVKSKLGFTPVPGSAEALALQATRTISSMSPQWAMKAKPDTIDGTTSLKATAYGIAFVLAKMVTASPQGTQVQ